MSTVKQRRVPRPPRRRHREIIEAAAKVFHEKGYEATSIQDIAESVGILKGSLYYYIRSKNDLLYEILRDVHEDGLANIQSVVEMEGDALQRIRAFATRHVTFNVENLVEMGVFFNDFRSLDHERRHEIVKSRDEYNAVLRGLILLGQEEGVVCRELDPKLAALATLGIMNWIYKWYAQSGQLSAEEVAEELADFIVAGLACTPEAHVPGHRRALAALPPELADGGDARANGKRNGRPSP